MTSKKEKPELIIFDLGNVLVDFDFKIVIRALKKHTHLSGDEIHEFFRETPLWDTYERGRISSADFFKELAKSVHLKNLTYEAFMPLWCNIFTEKPETVALLKKLKGRYTLAMLSNVNEMHWTFVRGKHAFMKWFEIPIASYAVGMRKPEAAIFRHVLEKAKVPAAKAVFTDDLAEHVAAAKAVGIRAHQFTTAKQLAKDLEDLL